MLEEVKSILNMYPNSKNDFHKIKTCIKICVFIIKSP
jgi:hypothetical protein